MGTIGKYIDTKLDLKKKKKKKNLLEDACKLYSSGCRESESVSANQRPGRSSLYTEQHDFKHVEYFLSANFLWNPSSSWIEVSEPMRNKCDHHWWHIRPNNINVKTTSTSSVQNFINIRPKVSWKRLNIYFLYIYNVYEYIFFKWIPNWAKFLKILRNSRSLLQYKFWFI